MSTQRIKWNMKGFKEVRRLPGVRDRLKREAGTVANAAGEGYEVRTGEGKTRSRATVITATPDAMRNESKNSSLLKAMNSRGQ